MKNKKKSTDLWSFDTFILHECFPPDDRVANGLLCLMQADNDLETIRELIRRLGGHPRDTARNYLYEAHLRLLVRLMMGIVHNAFSDILDGSNKKGWQLMAEAEFKEIVKKLSKNYEKDYKKIAAFINNKPDPLWPSLCRIRHNGIMHYSPKAFNKEVKRLGATYRGAYLIADPINERRFLISDIIVDNITLGTPNLKNLDKVTNHSHSISTLIDELFSLRDALQAFIQGFFYSYINHRGFRQKIQREKPEKL